MNREDFNITHHTIPDAVSRADWLPMFVGYDDDSVLWRGFFRCFRPCPKCRRDLSTNGRGAFRCPSCGYQEGVDTTKRRRRRCA